MSFATWNFLKVYARWREAFLRLNPQKRLIPDLDNDSDTPFISIGEKGYKIGGLVAVVIVILLLSSDRK